MTRLVLQTKVRKIAWSGTTFCHNIYFQPLQEEDMGQCTLSGNNTLWLKLCRDTMQVGILASDQRNGALRIVFGETRHKGKVIQDLSKVATMSPNKHKDDWSIVGIIKNVILASSSGNNDGRSTLVVSLQRRCRESKEMSEGSGERRSHGEYFPNQNVKI